MKYDIRLNKEQIYEVIDAWELVLADMAKKGHIAFTDLSPRGLALGMWLELDGIARRKEDATDN